MRIFAASGGQTIAVPSDKHCKEVVPMSEKNPNTDIRCRVSSCTYHCGDRDYCTLHSIQVEPCQNCGSGQACDESMCGSYRHK